MVGALAQDYLATHGETIQLPDNTTIKGVFLIGQKTDPYNESNTIKIVYTLSTLPDRQGTLARGDTIVIRGENYHVEGVTAVASFGLNDWNVYKVE